MKATGRVDILASRILERLVESQPDPALRAIYWTLQPVIESGIRDAIRSAPVARVIERAVKAAASQQAARPAPRKRRAAAPKPKRSRQLPKPEAGGRVIDVEAMPA